MDLVIGLFIGAALGFVVCALLGAGQRADEASERQFRARIEREEAR